MIDPPETIAIVGMAGRFPGAATLGEFWANLRAGREAVTFFDEAEVQWLPLDHRPVAGDPHFVRARAALDRPEWFDAEFFRLRPHEAAIMDPQHRVFLECAWEALENAGCNPENFAGAIGVFAGSGFNTYLFNNLLTNPGLVADYGLFAALTLNDKDYLATRVAYKLNLNGPALNVQTACSTSLVAVALACQHLLDGHCDVALAGGVAIGFPTNRGHQHVDGGIMSKDGHCRAFDAKATGTVAGHGAGVVVLRRLSDALAAGDRIVAVIKGSAVNNDGGVKMGFTAPAIEGQAECIALAQAAAGCPPETIAYVETHGTGTPLGDPIEVAALAQAFALAPGGSGRCAIGSVKTNIGHLDVAAGVAGLMKTALALQHGEIPPSLHYETPNPQIDFVHSPFFVNDRLRPWPRGGAPRRAGVSSFGIGGTNAHVVIEEAPDPEPTSRSCTPQLLVLSARTPAALDAATENLALHFEHNPDAALADAAFTLQTGRKAFEHRRAVVASTVGDAVAAFRSRDGARPTAGEPARADTGVVFMFPGQGAQSVNMARELHGTDSEFRQHIDSACEMLAPRLGLDLREVIFSSESGATRAAELLRETRLTQPALFVIEHALARRWMRWGIVPSAMIGHSLGEYVAACVAGVFSIEDALALVAERARLMQARPAGAMLAIRLPESGVAEWLDENLALAAVNARGLCVVSGPFAAIEALERKLAAAAVVAKRLATSHAFHSAAMEPAMAPLADFLRGLVLRAPQIRWVSNLTGTWITPREATSPDYWAAQMRGTVRFADGIEAIVQAGHHVLLEVGPGITLAGLARQHAAVVAGGVTVAATLDRSGGRTPEVTAMLQALGQLWVAGVTPDWRGGVHHRERRRIVTLPTYPFERTRCWIEPGAGWAVASKAVAEAKAPEPLAPASGGESAGSDDPPALAAVMQTFRQLSGIDLPRAAADQTFNQLGFDSLFLTQASVAIGRLFGIAISFRQLRDEFTTPRNLAEHLARPAAPAGTGAAQPNSSRPTSSAAGIERRLPMTEAQREIWVVSQLGPAASAAYNESAVIQLAGPLNLEALRWSLRELVARHEALRTTFAPDGGSQIIAPQASVELTVHDCTAADSDGCLAREGQPPFDLARGPLLRPVLARIDAHTHVLGLIVHHIVCDGWSLGILVRELAELYASDATQRRPALPRAPSFAAYAEQEAAEPRATEMAASETYWREHFADTVPALDLPTDRPRPARRSYAGDFAGCTFPPELTAAVKRLCAEHECTVFTGLLAVFSALLHRLTGQADLVVGVPTAGQALDGHPTLVGHFANLLPIRTRLGEGQSFVNFLGEVQRSVNEALVHGRYPFVRLLQQLKLPRDASRVPLAPVLFNTTSHRGAARFGDVAATLTFPRKRHVNFDLTFNLALTDDGIALACYYSTELFEPATVARWLGHFQTLLRGILSDPDACVANLPLLTSAERQTMLVDWNQTALAYRRDACIHDLFEEQVCRTPHAVALVCGPERLDYRELDSRAGRLAAKLRAAGVKPGVLVGVLLERSAHLLVAILAVLKAGGAYVPLDPTHPPSRRGFIVTDSHMQLVVTQRRLLDAMPSPVAARVVLVDDEPTTAEPIMVEPSAPPEAGDPAYVLYTSGSTGQPKGVCVPHRGVVALIAWARQHYRREEFAGVLWSTPATFDVSVLESLVPLCLGGKVILAPHLLQPPDGAAPDEVTLVSGVPSAMAELVRLGRVPLSVRTVNVAGEPCPQTLVEALYALPHIERVYDLYGPTETTVYSTGGLRRAGGRATIGRPLANERVYVLDARQQPVPIGIPGELYIGGDKLASGYLNRPELTAQKFVEVPAVPAERLFRTGDRVRFLPDGTLEFLGRLDHQVKLRGYRIELAEIEAALREHRDVVEAIAAVRADSRGAQHLLAYVVLRLDATVTAAGLREHLMTWLPAPMVPVCLTLLERLPRTTSGKVDRGALPAPVFESGESNDVEPRTEVERILGDLWREVLGVEPTGVHANFFALGGHSLHAMQLISRIGAVFEIELSFQQFFATPTISGLARALEVALVGGTGASIIDETGPAPSWARQSPGRGARAGSGAAPLLA